MNKNEELEALLNLANVYKDYDKTINELKELENALFRALDIEALGIARCLEQEIVMLKTSMTRAAIYNAQLQHLIKKHTNDE